MARLARIVAARILGAGLVLALGLPRPPAHADDLVRMGVLQSASAWVFHIADVKGFLAAEGITPLFIVFDSGAKMTPALSTGELDVGVGAASSALYNAAARGVKLSAVADALHTPAEIGPNLLVRTDLLDSGQVKLVRDLKGRKVAVSAEASSEASSLNQVLRGAGLGYGDVDKIYVGFPQHVVAFQNKGIDASLTGEPFANYAISRGLARIFEAPDLKAKSRQTSVIMFNESFGRSRRELAVRFLKAFIRGARVYNEALDGIHIAGRNADEVVGIISQRMGLAADIVRQVRAPGVDPNGELKLDAMKEDWAFFRDQGQIDGKVKVEDVVDTSYVASVLKELGRYERK